MILDSLIKPKRYFDVNSRKDIQSYKFFLKENAWGTTCPFVLEYPYLSVPDMIKDKLIHKFLKVKNESRN